MSDDTPTPPPMDATADQILALLRRARDGDEATLPVVRDLLEDPGMVDHVGGDLARAAEGLLIQALAGPDLVLREALLRKLDLLRAELAGPDPTPVERLLAERAAACWLQVQDADLRTAQAKDLTVQWATYYQARMDRAHRRYLQALKTLAAVRKLAVPVLQVNIAKKQVAVAGPTADAT
jgi:hypothetical protein